MIKAKKNRSPAKYFGNKKMTLLGLDEISTFVEGKVVKIFFGFTMLTQKNVQFNLSRLLQNIFEGRFLTYEKWTEEPPHRFRLAY